MQKLIDFIDEMATQTALATVPNVTSRQLKEMSTKLRKSPVLSANVDEIEELVLQAVNTLLSTQIRNNIWISEENNNDIHTDNEPTDTSNRPSDTFDKYCDPEFTPGS